MKDGLTGWALGRLGHGAGKNKLDSHATLDDLVKRFGLDGTAREVLALAWAAERSLEVAKAAREAAGPSARALTVEVARDALGQPLDAILAAGAPLRRYALVTLDTAGPALATSELRLGMGVCPRLDGTPLDLDQFAPGVRLLRDAGDRFPASAKVAELVKDRLVSVEALLATVDGCPRRDALALAVTTSKRFSRGLLTVDGEVLAGLQGRWELLAALRREADLESLVLLVHQAAALGEAWRALAAPPAQNPRAPLIILTDAARLREVTLVEGLRHQPMALNGPPAEKPPEAPAPAPKEDPYELIRRQAQRDAERALGVWRPDPAPATKGIAPLEPVKAEPVKAEPVKAEPVKAEPVKAEPVKVEPVKAEPPKVEASDEKPKKRRSKKAIEHFGADPEEAAPPPPPAAAAPPPTETAATDPVEGGGLSADAPYLPVPDKPTPDMLAVIARTSRNARQRLELLEELKTLKIPSVVQAMRDNVKSADPAIRAVAEAAMASFFGPNWNRTRAVAKPVQPPPGDDKNPNRPW